MKSCSSCILGCVVRKLECLLLLSGWEVLELAENIVASNEGLQSSSKRVSNAKYNCPLENCELVDWNISPTHNILFSA